MSAPTMASIVADVAAAKAAATIARLHAEAADLRDKLDTVGLSEAELERCCKDLDLQITDLTTDVERLHGCQTAYQNTIDGLGFLNTKLMEERDRVVERLSRERDEALKALKPFADEFGEGIPRDDSFQIVGNLNLGHFRAASRSIGGRGVNVPTMASIVADVAAAHRLPVSVLRGRSRYKRDVRARQEAIWRCREVRQDDGRPRYALQQIGQFFKRHHTTIIHACKRHLERTT